MCSWPASQPRDARAKSPSSSTERRMSRARRACASLDEHGAQSLLQVLDLHRQSGLRDPTSCCRASEVAMTRQRIEIAKLPQRCLYHQNILSQQSLKSILPDRMHRVKLPPRTGDDANRDRRKMMDDVTKCPFTGGMHTHTNRDWWPNQLDVRGLHRNSTLSDPMGQAFDYAKEFKSLDLNAVIKDLHA